MTAAAERAITPLSALARRMVDQLGVSLVIAGSSTFTDFIPAADTILHIAQDHLPFGGVGHSGMGHYHGREGFETFSKLRPVFHQARFSSVALLAPPYAKLADRMISFLIR